MSNQLKIANNSTLSLKKPDPTRAPTVEYISDESFKNFMPTGIIINLNTPLVKTSSNGLFAINIDGFIPSYTFSAATWGQIIKNLFPVQNFRETLASVTIDHEQFTIPPQMMYLSYRMFKGNVGIGLRIMSNTSQSGNLIVTQLTGGQRRYYSNTELFQGLSFLNCSTDTMDYSPESLALVDISLNRNVSITPVRKDNVEKMDFVRKLNYTLLAPTPSPLNWDLININSSQFVEDWLLFGTLANIPNQNAGQVQIAVFFDYRGITPIMPIYPMIPTAPYTFNRQILRVSATLAIAMPTKALSSWLPFNALNEASELTDEAVPETAKKA